MTSSTARRFAHRACVQAAIAALAATPAWAVTATPATLDQAIASAKPGDTITLAPGQYGAVRVKNKTWDPAITIDSHAAVFSEFSMLNVHGLKLMGGEVDGVPGPHTHGIDMTRSGHITVTGMRVISAHSGVVLQNSEDIEVTNMTLSGLISDGIDIAISRRVLVDHNTCDGFTPVPATYADGKLLVDGDHPDCVQAWSKASDPPESDLTITNNTADGHMQGISLFNHIENGVDDGGFDRVIMTGNTVRTNFTQGMALYNGRNSIVRDNKVSSIPGSLNPRTGKPIKTTISVKFGDHNTVCGNAVPDDPRNPASARC